MRRRERRVTGSEQQPLQQRRSLRAGVAGALARALLHDRVHPVPQSPVDGRGVLARVARPVVHRLADVDPVRQQPVTASATAAAWTGCSTSTKRRLRARDPIIRERFDTYRFANHKEKVANLIARTARPSVGTISIAQAMREESSASRAPSRSELAS